MSAIQTVSLEILRSNIGQAARTAWPDSVSISIGEKVLDQEAQLNGDSYTFYLDPPYDEMFDHNKFCRKARFESWTPSFDDADEHLILTGILLIPLAE